MAMHTAFGTCKGATDRCGRGTVTIWGDL